MITHRDLAGLLEAAFLRHGAAPETARLLALNCAACERDGALSHGLFRMPGYLAALDSGWADGQVAPSIEDAGAAFVRADARRGFAQHALATATPLLMEKLRETGVAVLATRNSHHFSALWPDLEPFAREGLVALSFVAGLACVVPFGGTKPLFGTNPIAFATPVAGHDPLVFDLATSAMANGEVRIAAREGRLVPPETGIDRQGRPTTDPQAILGGGALKSFGGHKGSAITLMVEILASALTGGAFSHEVDYAATPGAEIPRTGQCLILIDPARGGNEAFAGRVAALLEAVRSAGQERLPSDRRYENRRRAEARGIPLTKKQVLALEAL